MLRVRIEPEGEWHAAACRVSLLQRTSLHRRCHVHAMLMRLMLIAAAEQSHMESYSRLLAQIGCRKASLQDASLGLLRHTTAPEEQKRVIQGSSLGSTLTPSLQLASRIAEGTPVQVSWTAGDEQRVLSAGCRRHTTTGRAKDKLQPNGPLRPSEVAGH